MLRVLLATICWVATACFAQSGLPEKMLITEYQVEGNSVLPTVQIEKAVMPFLGPDKRINDIYAARDELAKAYQAAGYVSATVEAERIDPVDSEWGKGWVAILKVTEGKVDRLKVVGANYNLPSRIKEALPSVAEGEVPNFPEFQQDLARVSRMNDVAVTPVLRSGKDPGTMEVEVQVQDSLPLHGSVEVNNDQSPGTSPRRLEAGVRYDNLFQAQHSLSAHYVGTPLNTDEIKVASLNYSLPTGVREDKLSFYGVRSDSNIATDTGTGIVGKGTTLGLRWSRTLRSESPFFHTLTLGVDYKKLDETSLIGSRPVTYTPFTLQYLALSPDKSGRWQFSSNLNIGFGGLTDKQVDCPQTGQQTDQFDCRREGASSSFLIWSGTISREQKLWNWQLDSHFDFQYASARLLPGDEFFIGGRDSVRGYFQSEQGGDIGGRFSLQLNTPNIAPKNWSQTLNFLTFYDQGWVRNQSPMPASETNPDYRLASYGVGLRLQIGRYLSGSLDLAHVLLPGPNTQDGTSRLEADMKAEF